MLASLADAPLDDPAFVYEPKYDGIRAVAEIAVRGGSVKLWSRLGNDKARQFPEIVAALRHWARRRTSPLVLDGEIVALDANGHPAGFQNLQRRTGGACAFIGFDVLRDGASDLRGRPLVERRQALERIFARTGSPILRLSDVVRGDGRALYARALAGGWEGLIAKRAASLYLSGKRTPDWRKIKITHVQEFVVGGWTEPRETRSHFGALLLGVYEHDDLLYAGHVGTGFDERELARLIALLRPIEVKKCPFLAPPPSNEKPHWVRPKLVAEVKFTEWTADGSLRHPVYLGLRDDKAPRDVTRETKTRVHTEVQGSGFRVQGSQTPKLVDELRALEAARRDGVLTLDGGASLKVTNLHKVFWPKQKLTKGDLMRYYVEVAPFILPAVADRPLVMKRYPNGITGAPFYQHRATDVPAGVRVETVHVSDHDARPQIVGGDLTTLLYMTQLAAISQDPWFSRVSSSVAADYVALDLDPMPGVPFAHVLDVAKWIRDELALLGGAGVPKTSGADGLHVYVALPPGTPYDAGLLFCQIVATVVAQKHPKLATVERSLKARGRRVYIDYLQNILGKTLATAYSARASDYAGVSTPLTWDEVDAGVEREAFTIATVPARLRTVGDLWAPLRTSKGVNLSRVTRYGKRR
jgi:bifunctional non-homologous end joining protein LigD